MPKLKIELTYDDKVYAYEFGSEAYIFHTGIYNDFDKKYGIDMMPKYVALVQECYLDDDNRTPLGSLADYIAEHWEDVKDKSSYDILEDFYWSII